jgi:putative drug exporter of the RND superfamily
VTAILLCRRIWGVTAAVALLALAAPALGMRLGEPAVDLPPGQAVVATTSAIQRAFPQTPSPAEVVVTGPGATGPRVMAEVAALQGARQPEVPSVSR